MTHEEEVAAGMYVDSICCLCGAHAPPEQKVRDCCDAGMLEDLQREPDNG